MRKALKALPLLLLAVLALTAPARADLIWTPDDPFYEQHWEECAYVNRRYQLGGYDGSVTVFTAPGGMNKAALDNGLQGRIQFTWEGKGTTWGYLCNVAGSDVEGWVPMDDLSLIYDSQAFAEDHAGQITEDFPEQVDFHEAVLYDYPNGTAGEILTEAPNYLPFSQTFTRLYTDENGLSWGYVGYYMGNLDCWVCLDDPMNETLNSGIVPISPSPAQLRGSATVTAGPPVLLVAAGLVAAVTAVTAVLLLKRKKRNGRPS